MRADGFKYLGSTKATDSEHRQQKKPKREGLKVRSAVMYDLEMKSGGGGGKDVLWEQDQRGGLWMK